MPEVLQLVFLRCWPQATASLKLCVPKRCEVGSLSYLTHPTKRLDTLIDSDHVVVIIRLH